VGHGLPFFNLLRKDIAMKRNKHVNQSKKRLNRKIRVLREQKGKCVYCQEDLTVNTFTFDHIQPKSQGGPNGLHNLVGSCYSCNQSLADVSPKTRLLVAAGLMDM
jgi:uncharacterized protein (TIGR02646 family)